MKKLCVFVFSGVLSITSLGKETVNEKKSQSTKMLVEARLEVVEAKKVDEDIKFSNGKVSVKDKKLKVLSVNKGKAIDKNGKFNGKVIEVDVKI